MSGTWKGVTLTLVIILAIIFLYNIFDKPVSSESDQAIRDQMTQRYYEHLERNETREIDYMKKAEESLAKVHDLNDRSIKNEERFEDLLDRWEKQADRYDAVLKMWEEQAGIKSQ